MGKFTLKIALSDGDTVTDYGKDGKVKRVRVDRRNASYATLWLLQRLDKDRFGDSKRVEVDGQVSHQHQHAHAHLVGGANTGGYHVDFQSVRDALTEDEARVMLGFLERIEECRQRRQLEQHRENQQSHTLPPGQGQHGDSK